MTTNVVKLPGSRRPRHKFPAAPVHVTGLARDEWRRVAAVLSERGDLGPEVLGTLEVYVLNYARWRDAEAHVAEEGPVVPAPNTGTPMHSVMLTVANKAGEMVLKLAKALRITPDTRPSSSGKPAGDQWEGLL